jgi:type VI secretion system secreted protein Hcp
MSDSYLQLDGVPGESLDANHKDWIELLGFGHEMTQPVSNTTVSAGGASTGRTQHGDFAITKYVDKASPKLYEAVSNGKHFGKAKIQACRAGTNQVVYLEINLEQVMVSNVQLNHSNGQSTAGGAVQLPTETVHFNYGKIEWVYTQQKRQDGSGGGNVTAKFDLTTGKA